MRYYLIAFGLIFLIIMIVFLLPEKEMFIEFERELTKEGNSVATDSLSLPSQENFCVTEIEFLEEGDKKFCFRKSKLKEERGIEIDLTNNRILLYKQGKLIKIFPLLYQAPEEKWFQTPTGYLRVGVKKVVKIQPNDGKDHGLGNTVIIKHQINNEEIYSLYAHLSSIEENIIEGVEIKKGGKIGKVGNSGYGCQNYWRVGPDGCDKNLSPDTHLHFEIKKAPLLENPLGGKACWKRTGEPNFCYGYTPDYSQKYGYLNPIKYLFNKSN